MRRLPGWDKGAPPLTAALLGLVLLLHLSADADAAVSPSLAKLSKKKAVQSPHFSFGLLRRHGAAVPSAFVLVQRSGKV